MAPCLRAAGHQVHAPTLTGLGHRSHLLDDRVDLELHVRDLLEVLACEDLQDVVLVGHSYAGMVMSGVADRVPERLARLVYLDAFVPVDGQSLFELLPPARREMFRQAARERGEGRFIPPPSAAALGVTDPVRAAWVDARLRPQPVRTFEQPLRLGEIRLPRSYVHCTDGASVPSFAPFAQRAKESPDWRYHELATGHDAMLTVPAELAGVLLATAA